MTSHKKFFLITSTLTATIFLIITLFYFTNILSKEYFKSIITAGLITSFNAVIGIISIKSGINKPEKIFFRRIFGGIVVRLFLTLILLVLTLVFLELNRISFIFSILFFYIFYLITEIIYLNLNQN